LTKVSICSPLINVRSVITLELINKKRNPVKHYAVYGVLIGIITVLIVGFIDHWLKPILITILLIASVLILIISLFIINYSVGFKKISGRISFYDDYVKINTEGKTETIQKQNIRSIRYKLSGYEGMNNSTLIDFLIWFPGYFSYHSGMNNFVYIYTDTGLRIFEFHIPNKACWIRMKEIARTSADNFRNDASSKQSRYRIYRSDYNTPLN